MVHPGKPDAGQLAEDIFVFQAHIKRSCGPLQEDLQALVSWEYPAASIVIACPAGNHAQSCGFRQMAGLS